jgi:hypothetical protein
LSAKVCRWTALDALEEALHGVVETEAAIALLCLRSLISSVTNDSSVSLSYLLWNRALLGKCVAALWTLIVLQSSVEKDEMILLPHSDRES